MHAAAVLARSSSASAFSAAAARRLYPDAVFRRLELGYIIGLFLKIGFFDYLKA